VQSELGRGTTVRILFPVAKLTAVPAAARESPPSKGAGRIGTILVVDDEEVVRSVAKLMLEDSGFTVLTAHDGRAALDVFRDHGSEIDAVVLDMTMPHLSGEEVFREIRRMQPDVRVILSSGYNEQDATDRFAGKGLAGFLQKPYRSASLVEKLREVMNGQDFARKAAGVPDKSVPSSGRLVNDKNKTCDG